MALQVGQCRLLERVELQFAGRQLALELRVEKTHAGGGLHVAKV
jgi:hypothetical protein